MHNPRLFDTVRFKTLTGEAASLSLRTGTLVELLGPETALVEVSDEAGIPKEFAYVPIRDLEVIWRSSESR